MPADSPMVLVPRERLIRFAYEFVREQAEGEWGDNLIAKDAEKLIAGLTALSAPSTTSTAEQDREGIFSPFNACCYRETCRAMARAAPTPGEGEAS